MSFVKVSNFNGFIFRKESLREKNLSTKEIELVMQSSALDEGDELLSFGPSFGGEAAKEFSDRLEKLGLVYVDDFFIFEADLPDWLEFGAQPAKRN